MRFKHVKVCNLLPSKIWANEGARTLPSFAILVEDAVAKDRCENFLPRSAQRVICELCGQNSLHVLRLDGGNNCRSSVSVGEGVRLPGLLLTVPTGNPEMQGFMSRAIVSQPASFVHSPLLARFDQRLDDIQTV